MEIATPADKGKSRGPALLRFEFAECEVVARCATLTPRDLWRSESLARGTA
jgi:hypothetical protein